MFKIQPSVRLSYGKIENGKTIQKFGGEKNLFKRGGFSLKESEKREKIRGAATFRHVPVGSRSAIR